jgi:glycerol uptake facilitator-like aquaporin
MQLFNGTYKNPIKQIWIYLVGPFLGAVIAAFVWPIFIFEN